MVQAMGQWESNQWMWIFEWRRRLFQWESELVEQLRLSLGCVRLNLDDDSWGWVPDNCGGVFACIWKSDCLFVAVATQSHSDSQEFRLPGSATGHVLAVSRPLCNSSFTVSSLPTFVWLIWEARNDALFANDVKQAEHMVEDIKRMSWQWNRIPQTSLMTPCSVCVI
ncbi:hypothetical protein A2U01_0024501 [Trifolium medium]|uniref:Uncharacterized protein n=1 Tax=Trifolium medium TaxID=97028 RepID=A0A392NUF2_9FABA|nr:hypothetical protein [Trifolium medium]